MTFECNLYSLLSFSGTSNIALVVEDVLASVVILLSTSNIYVCFLCLCPVFILRETIYCVYIKFQAVVLLFNISVYKTIKKQYLL